MTPDRFRTLAAIHGADLARWPHAERGAAARVLRSDPQLAAELDIEARVDDALRRITPAVSDERCERVAADVLDRIDRLDLDPTMQPWTPPRSLWPAMALLLCMGVLGYVAGGTTTAEADALTPGLGELVASDTLTISLEP